MQFESEVFARMRSRRSAKQKDCLPLIVQLVEMSETSRREGLLALEDYLDNLDFPLLQKGLQLVMDGTDPELVQQIMRTRILASGIRGSALMRACMAAEGVLAIQCGDNPRMVGDKLAAYFGDDTDLWDIYQKEREAEESDYYRQWVGQGKGNVVHEESQDSTSSSGDDGEISFSVLERLSNVDVQKLLREVDTQCLAIALKGASPAVREKIIVNMSKRAGILLIEDMDFMGPVLLQDVQAAQDKILDVLQSLVDRGDVLMPGRGEVVE